MAERETEVMERLVVTVPKEVKDDLKEMAYKKDLTLSYIVTKILEGYFRSRRAREGENK